MTWLRRVPLTVCLGLALVSVALAAPDAPVASEPPGLRAYVEGVLKDLAASELKLTLFQDAAVDTVEKHDTPAGIPRYTCWLKNAKGKAGYVAVAETKAGFRVISFSASVASPEPLLRELDSTNLAKEAPDFRRLRVKAFVAGVPLVANLPFTLYGTGEPRQVSETACCLASVFSYLQSRAQVPLFGKNIRPDSAIPEFDVIFCQFHKIPWRAPFALLDAAARAKPSTLPQQMIDAEKAAGISPSTDSKLQAQYLEERGRAVLPIAKRQLLQTSSPAERLEALLAEESIVRSMGPLLGANGVPLGGLERAVLLDWSYLSGEPAPERLTDDLGLFLRSRGMIARFRVFPFPSVLSDKYPFLSVAGEGAAVTCLGSLESSDQRFSLLFAPVTGTASSTTFAEYKRQKGFKQIRKTDEDLIRVTDFLSQWPDILQWGVHAVDVRVLDNWRAILLTEYVSSNVPAAKQESEKREEQDGRPVPRPAFGNSAPDGVGRP